MDLLLMLVCFVVMAATVAATTSNYSIGKPYSREDGLYGDHVYGHMARLCSHRIDCSYDNFVRNARNLLELERHRLPSSMERQEKRDVEALLSFKKHIRSDPSGKLLNWTAENSKEVCSWYGITCRPHTRRVVAVILPGPDGEDDADPNLQLGGTLSQSLGNLSLLHTFNLSGNSLAGGIPPGFGKLKALRVLDLSYNYLLGGSIPKALWNCTRLKWVGLAANNLEGTIPTEVGRLVELEHFDLSGNYFWSGSIGSIVTSRRSCTSIFRLEHSDNKLVGTIPPSLGNCSSLKVLYLGHNRLSGPVPMSIFNLPLSRLDLSSNNIKGSVPEAIVNMSKLEYLDLSRNDFKGMIPKFIGNLSKLEFLNFGKNNLKGIIPKSIGKLHSLKYMDFSSNNLFGSIPYSISGLVSLRHLILSKNRLKGTIPTSIGNCTSLTILSAYSNNFSGNLPAPLACCTHIQLLDLSINNFTGRLPMYLPYFHDLLILDLGYNSFHGGIPKGIANLTVLRLLDLSNNKLNGRIPSDLKLQGFAVNLSALTSTLMGVELRCTILFEEMTLDIKGHQYTLSYLLPGNTILDLSNNNLIGEIPASIGSLSCLRLLNLSGNQLEGEIPPSLGSISTLEQLDLAKNHLRGKIPEELSKLYELGVLNVSSNNLCGPIPKGTQFSCFNANSFQNNSCLCGWPLNPCDEKESPMIKGNGSSMNNHVIVGWFSRIKENISFIALGMGLSIGFGGVVGMFIMWKKYRHWVLGMSITKPRPFYGVYRLPT